MTATPAKGPGDRVDRTDHSAAIPFVFDGRRYLGHPGDTLGSALLANGVRTVGRSLYHDRPRGIFGAGVEEAGALVRIIGGSAAAPMVHATQVELYAGLRAESLSGLGRLAVEPSEDRPQHRFDRAYEHCDVLVVGGGPTGLAAARAAAASGARVILVDERCELGGSLLETGEQLDGEYAGWWVHQAIRELSNRPEVQILTRTTAVGYYDHNYVTALERRTEHLGDAAPAGAMRQRLWHLRASRVILATGALERPIVFTDNDRPGIMLASAAQAYVNRYSARPGRRAVVFTACDSGYAAAADLLRAGLEVAAVVDVRPEPEDLAALAATARAEPGADLPPPPPWPSLLRWRGVEVLRGQVVVGTDGPTELTAVHVAHEQGQRTRRIECDLLAVSGGWNPNVHLFSQSRGQVRYDEWLAAFVPDRSAQAEQSVGAARGVYSTTEAIEDGAGAGAEAARLTGFTAPDPQPAPRTRTRPEEPLAQYWAVPPRTAEDTSRQYVDLERDATVLDLARATRAGLRSVEHIKRFTTVGTASDQGKTSGVVATGVVAELLGRPVGEIGTTTYRPPYVPVTIDALAGRDRGELSDPVRVTALHDWHVRHGAVFEDVGQWKRPWYYPRPGETMHDAVLRECQAARESVAVMDASTLGKIDVQGPDAADFLDRVYTNKMSTLSVGRCRYGVMCGADGMVFDDGVTIRLGDNHFVTTTTTGNAAAVLDAMEELLQTEWPDLRVFATSVTDHWATVALVGPRSREVLAALAPDLDVSVKGFPFMSVREAEVADVPARVCRISFSGELAYEINVPAWYATPLWETVWAAGRPYGITAYGTETMHVLRAEKGFAIIGQETDGTVTPDDLGMNWVVSKKKADFVGKRSHSRVDTSRSDRQRLVGLLPDENDEALPEGAQLVVEPGGEPPVPMVGRVTSSYRSATLDRPFALGLVQGDYVAEGGRLYAPLVDRTVAVTVTSAQFYDPEGRRRDG